MIIALGEFEQRIESQQATRFSWSRAMTVRFTKEIL